MADLTSKEILEGLKKLGINTFSEFRNYFREYKLYYSPERELATEKSYSGAGRNRLAPRFRKRAGKVF